MRLSILPILSGLFFLKLLSLGLCRFPLIFSCPADHAPDWQLCILQGMVEARTFHVKKTHTTHTFLSLCRRVVRLAQTCMPLSRIAIRRVEHKLEIHSNESRHLAEGTEVARLRRRFSFVLQQVFSSRMRRRRFSFVLQTGGGACEHPTASFARPGVCTRASYREDNRV